MDYCSSLTQGVYFDACKFLRGGFRDLYAVNVAQIEETQLIAGEISAITMKLDPLSSVYYPWFSLRIKDDTGGVSNPAQIGNNRTINQNIVFSLEGFDTALKERYEELVRGKFAFIAVRHDGTAHMVGRISGAKLTTGDLNMGVALDDLVGAPLEFTADGEQEVTRTIIPSTTIEVLDKDGVTIIPVTL